MRQFCHLLRIQFRLCTGDGLSLEHSYRHNDRPTATCISCAG